MEALTLETTETQYRLSVDKEAIDPDVFYDVVERLRVEVLAQKMNTDEADLMQLADEIKSGWWQRNQEWVMEKIRQYEASQAPES